MSLQFCYTSTPNVEEEAFRLLVLFDLKVDLVTWTAVEALLNTNINAQRAKLEQVETAVEALYKSVQRLRCQLLELGV